MEEPGIWDVPEKAQEKVKLLNSLKDEIDSYNKLKEEKADIETIIEMGEEEPDPELVPEAQEMLDSFKKHFEDMRLKTLLSGEYDADNAIVTLHPGAGGTEACDWASMLYRMYTRWAESKGFDVEVRDYLDGDEAGIKSVTFQVNGPNAYGLMQSERECIVWCVFPPLMQREKGRLHLSHAKSFLILRKTSTSISTIRT